MYFTLMMLAAVLGIVGGLATKGRWPRLSRAIVLFTVAAVVALPLFVWIVTSAGLEP